MDNDKRAATWLDSLEVNIRIKVEMLIRRGCPTNTLITGDRAVAAILTGLLLLAQSTPDPDLSDRTTFGGLYEPLTPQYVAKLCRMISRDPIVWRVLGEAEFSGFGDNPV